MNGGNNMNTVAFTIFGGTGDLTFRKLLPAFYNLLCEAKMKEDLRLIVIGRRNYTSEEYHAIAKQWVQQFARLPYREQEYNEFIKHIEYVQMDFTNEQAYASLNEYYMQHNYQQHIYYLAVAPRFFKVITDGLVHVQYANEGKVIVEKPFGEDLTSAKLLNQNLEAFFGKQHVFHIDHYLGKEMIRNIQTIRFMNPIFQHVWSKESIEHIQISATESIGVENRGDYYDKSGALKDMVQNHLFQILSIIAMEEPTTSEQDMQKKQLQVLQALRPVDQLDMKESMVLGQYFNYQKEDKVAFDSMIETYAALRLFVDNQRWKDVPIYIRTGKKLQKRETQVVVTFKKTNPNAEANVLMIKIQPEEGVYVQFNVKRPGESDDIILAQMDFCQSCIDQNRMNTPEAYERLLLAAMQEETSWFSKWEQIEVSWNYIDELKRRYQQTQQPLTIYSAGSDGPREADELLAKHGHTWFNEINM